jgi:hypothetical protein
VNTRWLLTGKESMLIPANEVLQRDLGA